jgi:hypothetical protein
VRFTNDTILNARKQAIPLKFGFKFRSKESTLTKQNSLTMQVMGVVTGGMGVLGSRMVERVKNKIIKKATLLSKKC